MSDLPLLNIVDLVKHFPLGGGIMAKPKSWVKAVDGVSFAVSRGESFGLVGESGCGKTTLGRLVLRLLEPTAGQIIFGDQELTALKSEAVRRLRSEMQLVFQTPVSSLSPRFKVKDIIAEPALTHHVIEKHEVEAFALR